MQKGTPGELPLVQRSNLKEKRRESCNSPGRRGQVSDIEARPETRSRLGMFGGSDSVTPAESALWRMAGVKVRGGWEENASQSPGSMQHFGFYSSTLGNPGGLLYTEMT